MPNGDWRGTPPPKESGPPVYDVVSASNGATLDLTILDEMILGVDCHWTEDPKTHKFRSRRCYRDEGDCGGCDKGERKIWIGFLAAYCHMERQRVVLRMGPEGARQFQGLRQALGGLRGVRVNLGLATASHTGSLVITRAREEPLVPLPRSHDVERTICVVLGCARLPGYRYNPGEVTADNAEATDVAKSGDTLPS